MVILDVIIIFVIIAINIIIIMIIFMILLKDVLNIKIIIRNNGLILSILKIKNFVHNVLKIL